MAAPRSLLLTAAVLCSAGFCAFVAAPRPAAAAHPQVSVQTAAVSAMALVTPQVGMAGGSRRLCTAHDQQTNELQFLLGRSGFTIEISQITGKRLERDPVEEQPNQSCWNMREDVSLSLRCRMPTVSLLCHEWTNAQFPKDHHILLGAVEVINGT